MTRSAIGEGLNQLAKLAASSDRVAIFDRGNQRIVTGEFHP